MFLTAKMVIIGILAEIRPCTDNTYFFVRGFGGSSLRRSLSLENLLGEDIGWNRRKGRDTALQVVSAASRITSMKIRLMGSRLTANHFAYVLSEVHCF